MVQDKSEENRYVTVKKTVQENVSSKVCILGFELFVCARNLKPERLRSRRQESVNPELQSFPGAECRCLVQYPVVEQVFAGQTGLVVTFTGRNVLPDSEWLFHRIYLRNF